LSLSNLGNTVKNTDSILNLYKTICDSEDDAEVLKKSFDAMRGLFNNLGEDNAIKSLKRLGLEGEDLLDVLIKCGMSSDDAKKKMAEFGTSGTKGVNKLGTAFTGLAAKIGISVTALKVLTGVLAGAALIFAGFKIYQQDVQKYVDSAKEAGSAWESSSESLDGQISRLKEINNALKEGNLTEEESYAIKSELYSIQQNIADSYGKQADGIDLVNGKLEEEIHLLERINSQTANDFLNENVTGIKKANKEIEKSRSLFVGTFGTFGEDSKAIDALIDKYGEYFTVVQDLYGQNKSVYFKGTAEQATEILGDFATDLRDLKSDLNVNDFADGLIEGVSKGINKAKGVLEEYQDLYDQARKAELYTDKEIYKFDGEDKTALKWISEYEKAVNDYNEALKSGDPSKITEASTALQKSAEAMNAASEGGVSIYSVYAEIINDIVSNLDQAAKSAHDFRDALGGNDNAIGRGIDQYAEQLKAIEITDVELKSSLDSEGLQRGEAAFRELINAAYDCKLITGKAPEDIQPLIDILIELGYVVGETASEIQDANEKIVSSYDDAVKSVSDLKSELGAISGAISEQGYSGNLSVDTYNSLIAISKDYTACVEYQNGALQLNAEKANALFEAKSELQKAEIELQKITEAAKWKENADEIARLTKEYDGLDPAIRDQIENLKKENDGIEANLVGYDLQIAAIEELTSAYGRWKAVSESDNSDSMYKDIQNAFKAIQEAQKTGQTGVGNIVYQAAVELLVPEGEDVKKYMSTLQKYIMDGSNGLSNFINDMVTNELMDRSGSEVKMKMGVTMEQICNTMKITPDMAKAIFNALEMYDFDFHWTDEDFNINTDDAMAELKAAQEEMNKTIAKINEMKEAGATVDLATGISLDDLEKKYAEQKSQVDRLMNSAAGNTAENTVEYTITANTEEADTALDAIKDRLEEILKKIEAIFKKELGDLGGGDTLSILNSVLNTLRNINAYKIADKTFTVTQYTTTTGTKPYGSISSHDQNIKNDTSAHAAAVASGTRHADAGIALVGDEYSPDGSPKPELIITDGAAYIAGQNGPEFVNLKDGDQVVPASETEKIIQRNPDVKRSVVPAFATGAGGYPAGSVQEDKYLEGLIGPTQEWLDQRAAQKAEDDALIKKLSAKAAEKSADDTHLNEAAKNKSTIYTNVSVGGKGDTSSLKNSGSKSGSGKSSNSSSDSSSSSKNEKSQFEKDYENRQHLLKMEKMDYKEYIDWLEGAYKDAYEKGEIELEDLYKYEEEVFQGRKDLLQDSIGDIEHKIAALEREPGNEDQIINYYNQIISNIDKEIADARARGLDDDDDYIQELLQQKWDYADEIADIQEEITENAKDATDELIEYRIDMLKQDLENEKDAAQDKLDTLKDFYDKQKNMLKDAYDEEKYLEEQAEKRKTKTDIEAELEMLKFDDSAWADKRRKELQEDLADAEKELEDFEKDHAYDNSIELLDKMYEYQASQVQAEIDAIDARLNDPDALFNQALRDIQNNTLGLYEEMIEYNNKYGSGNDNDIYDMWQSADGAFDSYLKNMGHSYNGISLVDVYKPTGYASGTYSATSGVHELFEGGKDEYVLETSDGHRYKMFSGLGDKVLNASATDFLYKFANNGGAFISNIINGLIGSIGSVNRQQQQVSLSTGDIVVQGNASGETVSAIRRAQRENIDYVLREFTRLNR
jgi:hypothetical protein